MPDPQQRNLERHGSPFSGVVLVFVVVMLGLAAYAFYGAHTLPDSAAPPTQGGVSEPTKPTG
jgi:hypothetical protein